MIRAGGGLRAKYLRNHVAAFMIIPAFFFRKKGYINFVPKSVRRPSVRLSVCIS